MPLGKNMVVEIPVAESIMALINESFMVIPSPIPPAFWKLIVSEEVKGSFVKPANCQLVERLMGNV